MIIDAFINDKLLYLLDFYKVIFVNAAYFNVSLSEYRFL